MKISHTNHSYLSPTKLNAINVLPVQSLLARSSDSIYTSDLNNLIVLDAKNAPEYHNNNERPSVFTLAQHNEANQLPAATIDSSSYPSNGPAHAIVPSPPKLSASQFAYATDHQDQGSPPPANDYIRSFELSAEPLAQHTQTDSGNASAVDAAAEPFANHSYRATNADEGLSMHTTTPSTLNSWNDTNAGSSGQTTATGCLSSSSSSANRNGPLPKASLTCTPTPATVPIEPDRTRNPLLSVQNRFLSLSISPPLSRRQKLPVLRGTFVSLYVAFFPVDVEVIGAVGMSVHVLNS